MRRFQYRFLGLVTSVVIGAFVLASGVTKIQKTSIYLQQQRIADAQIVYRQYPLDFFEDRDYASYYAYFADYTNTVLKELKSFPVPISYRDQVEYEDSYGSERTYGGTRSHEGTDIMHLENERGVVPVVSMTDGYVENIGWLKLGGYRVGILSSGGIYYYYAHLDSYATGLCEGSEVHAGELIGMMGDTGYGEEEGTRGQFPVHLHLGIYYYDEKGNEISLNPYPFLRQADVLRE